MRTFGPVACGLVATCFAITLAVAAPPPVAKRLQLDLIGLAASDQFGYSVASAGDFNGDGFQDIIVGAPFVGAIDAGAAYVFFGGPSTDAVADLTINGAGSDSLGWSVASAGDINGDGFDDIIVGAPGADPSGRAYVFLGGAVPNNVADVTIAGSLTGAQGGFSVSSAGDFNGDGYDDFLVAQPTNQIGFVLLYYGSANPDAQSDITFAGSATGDQYGYSMAPAGDVNGDGFDDFIVGAPFATATDQGQVTINFGYVGFNNPPPPVTLTGNAAGEHFGASVASAGDVNGDGFDDIIAGAPLASVAYLNQGQARIWFGGNPFNTTVDLSINGWDVGDQAGSTVASAGDVNGDGFSDFIVVSRFFDLNPNSGPLDVGRVDLYFGGNPPDLDRDLILAGTTAGDKLGFSVGSVDVNGDGFDDLLVGTPQRGATDNGRVQLYDFNRYHLLSPIGGELWNVGSRQTISWLGAEPADVWLSVDGGLTYDRLETGIGGEDANAVSVRVPHSPTRFARVQITPTSPAITGHDNSDSLFTIQSSVALLSFTAKAEESGVLLTWDSDPAIGSQGLAGYRMYRLAAGVPGSGARIGPETITETRYTDTEGSVGTAYRLFAVNGLGEELPLGETRLLPGWPLAAWPLPYRGGELKVSFAIYARVGESGGNAQVVLFDLGGRLVRTITRKRFQGAEQVVTWDGRDDAGQYVPNGIYFLDARSGSEQNRMKVVVMR